MEDAPAHRAEQPFPEPQRGADDEQEDREDDQGDGERAECRDPPDFAGDLTGLGLGQLDVCQDEGDDGIRGRHELVTQAGRRLRGPRGGGRRGGGAEGGGPAGGGVPAGRRRGFGARVRIVQGSAPGPVRARGVGFDDSSASDTANHAGGGALRCEKMSAFERRRLLTAELLSIGSELTVGETRDTNAGELARSLTGLGVRVDPPDRPARRPRPGDRRVHDRRSARADLVVSTGGLGPTPDDLTREAIAAATGETPRRRRRPRGLAARAVGPARDAVPRAQPQAGLADPVGQALCRTRTGPRRAGSSSGRTAGSSSPCPARRARCARCGADHVLPRLRERAASAPRSPRGRTGWRGSASRRSPSCSATTFLRATNPIVATYARVEAVDVRVSARRPKAAGRAERARRGRRGGRPRPPRRPRLGDRRDHLEPRRSGRGSASSAGRWRWSRSGPAAASTRCSATSRGSASTNRSRPSRRAAHSAWRRRRPSGLEASRRGAARELGGADVGIAVRARRGPATRRSRSRSSRRSASDGSGGSCS